MYKCNNYTRDCNNEAIMHWVVAMDVSIILVAVAIKPLYLAMNIAFVAVKTLDYSSNIVILTNGCHLKSDRCFFFLC